MSNEKAFTLTQDKKCMLNCPKGFYAKMHDGKWDDQECKECHYSCKECTTGLNCHNPEDCGDGQYLEMLDIKYRNEKRPENLPFSTIKAPDSKCERCDSGKKECRACGSTRRHDCKSGNKCNKLGYAWDPFIYEKRKNFCRYDCNWVNPKLKNKQGYVDDSENYKYYWTLVKENKDSDRDYVEEMMIDPGLGKNAYEFVKFKNWVKTPGRVSKLIIGKDGVQYAFGCGEDIN